MLKFSSTRPTSRVNLLSLECEPDINNHNLYTVTRRIYICTNEKFSSTEPTTRVNLLPSGCKLIFV